MWPFKRDKESDVAAPAPEPSSDKGEPRKKTVEWSFPIPTIGDHSGTTEAYETAMEIWHGINTRLAEMGAKADVEVNVKMHVSIDPERRHT